MTWRGNTVGVASLFTRTCSIARATRWRSRGERTRDRRKGAGARSAARTERRIQGPATGERATARRRRVPAPTGRHRATRRSDRAGFAGRPGAAEGGRGAVRSGAPERSIQSGVSANGRRPGELRKAHGKGQRANLRRHEKRGGEPHHHTRLMATSPGMGTGEGRGLFVVVEGPEGAGKSTLVRSLAARFLVDGRDVLPVREPGGTPVAEAARKLALKSKH